MAFPFAPAEDAVNPQPVQKQSGTFLSNAPFVYIQDADAPLANAPDANGYYYGLVSSTTYPVYELGCATDFSLSENLTMNDVVCDRSGTMDTLMARNYVEFKFKMSDLMPFDMLYRLLNLSTSTTVTGQEFAGIGDIANQRFLHVYAPVVYNSDTGAFFFVHIHRAKIVDGFNISMPFGQPWTNQVTIRGFVDPNMPSNQRFGLFSRVDSAIP